MTLLAKVKSHWAVPALALVGVLGSQGCAAVGLTLFGVGAGVTAGTSVTYTMDGIAYKTFSVSEERLEAATLGALRTMDIEVRDIAVNDAEPAESGRTIMAVAGDRTVDIQLDRLTSRSARMRVNVKHGWFFKDRATAAEIISQTEQTLDDKAAVSRNGNKNGK